MDAPSEFKDVGQMTMKMRMVKSQEELELYRKMAKIADHGGFAAREGTIHILQIHRFEILHIWQFYEILFAQKSKFGVWVLATFVINFTFK